VSVTRFITYILIAVAKYIGATSHRNASFVTVCSCGAKNLVMRQRYVAEINDPLTMRCEHLNCHLVRHIHDHDHDTALALTANVYVSVCVETHCAYDITAMLI
jgi:hypothetical protein